MRQILRHGFLILALLYGHTCCIAQNTRLTKEEVLKLYQESSLEKYYLVIDYYNLKDIGEPDSGYINLSINRFVKDTFDYIYQGDFNGNGKPDLLTALTPEFGCGYQFFLMDYETNKKARQVVKLNPACPYYCYLVPAGKTNEFTYYYLNDKKDTVFTQDVIMYKGELIDKEFAEKKPEKLKNFTINLRASRGRQNIVYHYNGKRLTRYLSEDGKEIPWDIPADTASLITDLMRRIDFTSMKKRNTHFDDAPSLDMEIVSKGKSVKFEDTINFFTGGSRYYSVSLASLYKLLYPEFFKESYW